MAQWLEVLAPLSVISSTHASDSQSLRTPAPRDSAPSSDIQRHCSDMHMCPEKQHTHTYKLK